MELLVRGALRDPGAQDVYVTHVCVSNDLRTARVYVRVLDCREPSRRQAAVSALQRGNGRLRRLLGPRLALRHTPKLSFVWDGGEERAARIDALLDEIHLEGKGEAKT